LQDGVGRIAGHVPLKSSAILAKMLRGTWAAIVQSLSYRLPSMNFFRSTEKLDASVFSIIIKLIASILFALFSRAVCV
jgi:hypothetical protein